MDFTTVENVENPTLLSQPRKAIKRGTPPSGPEKIRAELNVERWPAMWQPSKSKTKAAVRTMEREVTLSDGSRGISKLEVGFTQFGTVTTEDQRMFYALIKQWEDNGKPTSVVFFSDRLLARLLKKSWGTNVIDAITGSLRRLRLTPFRWIRSYHRSDSPRKEVEEEVPFTVLSDLKIIKRKVDGHVTNQQGYFQFDRNLLENLLTNYTKPLLLEEFFKLKSEIGQLIYTHIDLIMADKTRYERCTKDLFADLGLGELVFYRHASHRKQALDRALKELRGIALSTGVLKSAVLDRTKDGKDYKVIFQKGSRASMEQTPTPESENLMEGETDRGFLETVVINDYSKTKDLLGRQSEEVVRHFHKTVHGVERHVSQPKEIGQALSLITQYGFEKAKLIIEYAAGKDEETKFSIQHFGAVLSYASRAIADSERHHQQECPRKATSAEQLVRQEPERKRWPRGESRLAALTPEQYGIRFQKAKADLFAEVPFLAHQRSDSGLQEKMVRSRMVAAMERESMDLLPLQALSLPEPLCKIWPTYASEKPETTV